MQNVYFLFFYHNYFSRFKHKSSFHQCAYSLHACHMHSLFASWIISSIFKQVICHYFAQILSLKGLNIPLFHIHETLKYYYQYQIFALQWRRGAGEGGTSKIFFFFWNLPWAGTPFCKVRFNSGFHYSFTPAFSSRFCSVMILNSHKMSQLMS